MAAAQATEVADLKQKLELADEDITLINRRLDEAQALVEKGPFVPVRKAHLSRLRNRD